MASQITRPEGESPLVTGTVKECFGPTPPGGFRDRPSFPLYLIFSFVPLFLLGVFAWYGLSLEEVFRRSMAARTLERELDTLIQETDPLNIFAKWFKRINNDLWQKPGSVEEKTRELQKVIPPGPLAFSCYRFDASGTIVVPGALVGTLPDEVTRLWKILQGKRYERRLMTLTSDRWLGVNFPLAQIIRRPGEVFHTTTSNGLGLIGVFREGPASGTPGSLFIIPKEPGIVQILRAPELRELVPSFLQPADQTGRH